MIDKFHLITHKLFVKIQPNMNMELDVHEEL